jgi:F0F1-type ATP synthase membrane subunit b/b'
MERRLAQLTQALEEAQALQEQYAQQLEDANFAHKQRVGDMEVGGRRQRHKYEA